jgi:hypothetical protein
MYTEMRAGRPGFDSQQGLGFLLTTSSRPALELTQPPIQWAPSPGVKWPGHEPEQSPPSSAELTNEWSYTSTPRILLDGVVLN